MFGEKTLTDVVKGIRASKRDTGLYISSCIGEIKTELQSKDLSVKSNALQKLTFLQMMGYSMTYASFACIEVMSSPRFAHKRIGYLAGCQGCFNTSSSSTSANISTEMDAIHPTNTTTTTSSSSMDDTSGLLLLTINLLKKELRGASTFGYNGCYEAGLAVNFLSNVVTEDLARELLPEVSALTQHPSHAYLRKKAVLCLFQIYRKYPQALRLSFDKVQACLNDTDPAVVSCAVNVITELSTHNNPKNYLLLAPAFFQLLIHSSNNWMLIKVVKLLGSLLSEEPRLARKLLEPLANIVRTTQAKSLLFEALYTITLALPYCSQQQQQTTTDIIDLCSHHLQTFLEDTDPNLKYLGLVGFASLVENTSSLSSVLIIKKEHKELILKCLSDNDSTIRSRALELCSTFATKKNVVELITQLLSHVRVCDEEPYRKELISRIINICKSNRFALLETSDNFAWYLTHVLLELSSFPTTTTSTTIAWEGVNDDDNDHAELVMGSILAQQIMEIALRVLPIRPLAVQKMVDLLRNEWILRTTDIIATAENGSIHKRIHKSVLSSAAWIVGEYSHLLNDIMKNNSDEGTTTPFQYSSIIQALLNPHCSEHLSASTQAVYVQSAMKVFTSACCCCDDDKDLQQCILAIRQYLPYFIESTDADVQERAISFFKLIQEMGLFAFAEEDDSMLQKEPKPSSMDSEQEQSTRNINDTTNISSIQAMTATENLLNFDLGEQQDLPTSSSSSHLEQHKQESFKSSSSNQTSRIAKCRAVSKDLSKILIPEPMKPISAKAQRRLEQPSILLDAALDLSIFDSLITHDNASKAMMIYYHIQSNLTTSIEDVSFTRQTSSKYHPMSVEESVVATSASSPFDIFTESGPVKQQQQTYNSNRSGANAPFYLSSSSSLTAAVTPIDPNIVHTNTIAGITNASVEQQQPSNRFGTIQLLDEDETPFMNEVNGKNNKDHKKKKKSKKSATKVSSEETKMSEADMAVFFSSGTNTTSTNNATDSTISKAVVYKSDDEEDDSNNKQIKMKKANRAYKEFKSLANVDLTTPLGEEEIMPVRTHRQVPARTEMDPTQSKTKSKDSNVRKKKKKSKEVAETSVTTCDLLKFDVFEAVPNTMNAPTKISPFDMLSTTDDLLLPMSTMPKGNNHFNPMSFTAISNDTGTMDTIVSSPDAQKSTSSKHPWLHATVKADAYALSYKVYITSKGKSPTASILLRISNNGNLILRGVSLLFPSLQNQEVKISEIISPGKSVESPIKIGPFSYEKDESSGEYMSREIKGYFIVSEGNAVKIPFKVVLPCCLLFVKPSEPPSQDHIMSELSTGVWSSHSIKLHAATTQTTEATIRLLGSFIKAQVIGDDISSHINNAVFTLATATKKGNQVRALIKMTDEHIKIDVKCSNGNDLVGKALTSDLKRLIL